MGMAAAVGSVMSFDAHGGIVFRLDAQLHLDKLMLIALTFSLLALLVLLLGNTRYGKAIRTTAQDRDAARFGGNR
jgi:branched-subunit amino acid ABC-type transport system permease component